MKRIALLALALLAGCGGHGSEPKVTHAWVRLPAVPGRPAAAYFTVAGARSDDTLVRVESAVVKRIEMHESMASGGAGPGRGMMTMKPLASVAIPAGTEMPFAPGGRHLMLFDVDPAITPGTAIPLRFGFASGKTTEAEAKTVAAGEDAPY
jgi:copper(I)-binding protein